MRGAKGFPHWKIILDGVVSCLIIISNSFILTIDSWDKQF